LGGGHVRELVAADPLQRERAESCSPNKCCTFTFGIARKIDGEPFSVWPEFLQSISSNNLVPNSSIIIIAKPWPKFSGKRCTKGLGSPAHQAQVKGD
jgi:hypothetical protein